MTTATGFSFGVTFSGNQNEDRYWAKEKTQDKKTKPIPIQKYHDTKPVQPMDYSFGTSPKNNPDKYERAGSPNKSPKL